MWWWWIEFCLLIHTILWKYESIFDGHLFHLRTKCPSSLTPRVIFKIVINEICIVRFVARDKCLHSILPVRVELKYFFSPALPRPLISLFFLYASSIGLFASMVNSVTAAASWLTQWVYVLHWMTKKKWGQVEYKAPVHCGRKENYWYSISHHINIVFIRHTHTHLYIEIC